jgi:acyl-CoA thioesterase
VVSLQDKYITMQVAPNNIVQHMLSNDAFSQWLGIQVLAIQEGYSKLQMQVKAQMLNGFKTLHGGISFAFADSALAFACNNRNNLSVALDCSISYIKAVYENDMLTAEAIEIHNGKSTGVYNISISNQHNQLVAQFKGTCFRTGKMLMPVL